MPYSSLEMRSYTTAQDINEETVIQKNNKDDYLDVCIKLYIQKGKAKSGKYKMRTEKTPNKTPHIALMSHLEIFYYL